MGESKPHYEVPSEEAVSGQDQDMSFDIAQALVGLSLSRQEGPSFDTQAPALPITPEVTSASSLPSTKTTNDSVDELAMEQPGAKHKRQESLVVLQKSCDLHKFARNVRQRELDTVVERPERARAAILGLLSSKAKLETAALENFDILDCQRYGWLGDSAVEYVHGYVYPQELLQLSKEVSSKLEQGLLELPEIMPYGDLYLAPRSIEAINGCLGAVYDGVDGLFGEQDYQRAHVCIRPPGHHAAETLPSGFCWINNVHIALAYARSKYNVVRAAILDFDLHHGDGSQSIAWQLNERSPNSIGFFSMHDIMSFPCETGNIEKISEASVSIAAHGHHIHNVHLRPYKDEIEFDTLYKTHYATLLEKAAAYLSEGYLAGEKCVICISAGYDASQYESSGMQRHAVNVPTEFYERFTRDAVILAEKYCGGKILSVMEGGYCDRAITSASSAHILGLVTRQASRDVSTCYNLNNLKLLEKNWPCKNRNARKSGKIEPLIDPWLKRIDSLYAQYVATPEPVIKVSEEEAALMQLQKMTLRERKPRVAVPTSARSTRSTPLKSAKKVHTAVPKTPAIPSVLHDVKVETPTPVSRIEPNHSQIVYPAVPDVRIAQDVLQTPPNDTEAPSADFGQGEPAHAESSTEHGDGPVEAPVIHTPPRVSNIYDFVD